MVSSLPNELLRQIVESTRPDTLHLADYKERQKTLCALSLTSKTFRSIAQPLLLEFILIELPEAFDGAMDAISEEGGVETGAECEWLVIRTEDYVGEARDVEKWLRTWPSAKNLTMKGLHDSYPQRLSALHSLHQLRGLHLSWWEWYDPIPAILPALRSLTLAQVREELMIQLLNPVSLPSLEEFTLVECEPETWDFVEALQDSSFDQLLPQLRAISFETDVWENPEATFLHSAASRTLIEIATDELDKVTNSAVPYINIRIQYLCNSESDLQPTHTSEGLARIASLLEAEHPLLLQSIYFDHSFKSISSSPAAIQELFQQVSRLCGKRKIELVIESSPHYAWEDPGILPEFSRRQRERRSTEITVQE